MSKERPNLQGLIKPQTTAIEQFQNTVIRPIIKMQHLLIISFFKNYLKKRKIDFTILSSDQQKAKIKSILQKDIQFKNLLIGNVLGHFTVKEYDSYSNNSSEFNRRIINIIAKRLQDSISEF